MRNWVGAQNRGDRIAYANCYAERFTGLAGGARFSRRGWLTRLVTPSAGSRGLRFEERALTVVPTAARVELKSVSAAGHSAAVTRLLLVQTLDGPRIAHEQTFEASPGKESLRDDSFWLADPEGVVIRTSAPATWGKGSPALDGPGQAIRSVDRAALPKPMAAWLGRELRVFGAAGMVCSTRVLSLELRAELEPHPAMLESWSSHASTEPTNDAAMQIWRLVGEKAHALVGRFGTRCQGALWAAPAEGEPPPVAAPEPASAELGAELLSAFHALPAYRALQQRFEFQAPDQRAAWDEAGGRRSVLSLHLSGHTPLGFVSAEAGGPCSDFSASLSALWAVANAGPGTQHLRLLAQPEASDGLRLNPITSFDLDGDGAPEVLLQGDGPAHTQSLLRVASGAYVQRPLRSLEAYTDPC